MTRNDERKPGDGSFKPGGASSQPDSHAAARQRVLAAAEQLFREYGYQKTTVADIARAMDMSPANVYRFYESKRAIFEAVAISLLDGVEHALEAIANADTPAEPRLRAFLDANHRLSTQYFVGDPRIRDMVAVAMNERWPVIQAHVETIRVMTEQIVRDGIAEGVFHAHDPAVASACMMTGWMRFCHPLLINEPFVQGPEPEQLADFLISALRRASV